MSLTANNRPVYYFPDSQRIPDRSLLHLSLTSIARMLDFEPLNDRPELLYLPSNLRQHLLSYLAAYRTKGVRLDELQLLFDGWNHPDGLFESSRVRHLDLSSSIGSNLTSNQLKKSSAERVSFHFASLTHLCLAYPGPGISWPSFLSFAVQVPWPTHLSLAYWPSPSISTMNSDLSRLSNSLTNLQYLDVEGCTDWITLLCNEGVVDWTTSWKNVQSLNLSQGPMPIEVQFEGGPETEKWIQGEIQARQVEDSINQKRKTLSTMDTRPLQVEHGWSLKNSFLKAVVESAWQKHQERCRSRSA